MKRPLISNLTVLRSVNSQKVKIAFKTILPVEGGGGREGDLGRAPVKISLSEGNKLQKLLLSYGRAGRINPVHLSTFRCTGKTRNPCV